MRKIKEFKIGADPEVMLAKQGKIVPCFGLIPGDKKNPYAIKKDNILTGYDIQVDGSNAEFGIPPCDTCEDWEEAIQTGLNYLKEQCGEHSIQILSIVEFTDEQLNYPKSRILGCDPAHNVYTDMKAKTPDGNLNIRYAGGHIHVGYHKPNKTTSSEIIKILDLLIAVPALFYDANIRTKTYGLPGNCRFKSYGFEYRSPSNWWLKKPEYIRWIYHRVAEAINMYNKGFRIDFDLGYEIWQAVENCDLRKAEKLINKFDLIKPD